MSPAKFSEHKRHIYYIEKQFQKKFIMKFCLLLISGSILTTAIVYWLAQHSTTVAIMDGHVGVRTTADYLLPLMLQTMCIELVIVGIATIITTLLVSHKIAGPLYRLKIMLNQLGGGDLSGRMHLRSDDQLKNIADSYNDAVQKMNEKIKTLKNVSSLDELKKELDQFKTS